MDVAGPDSPPTRVRFDVDPQAIEDDASAAATVDDKEELAEIQCAKPQTHRNSPKPVSATPAADADDSELSELDDNILDVNMSDAPMPAPEEPSVDDIGEVVPDHWSGTVPVFKPDMRQFKDFKLFVCASCPSYPTLPRSW